MVGYGGGDTNDIEAFRPFPSTVDVGEFREQEQGKVLVFSRSHGQVGEFEN